MEREDFINSVNLNAGTDFPYLVLDVGGSELSAKPGLSCDART